MRIKTPLCVGLALSAAMATAQADDQPMMLKMQVEREGQILAAPGLLVNSGEPAGVKVDDALQLTIAATDRGGMADLKLSIAAGSDGVLTPVSAPRIVAAYGRQAEVGWTDPQGRSYRLKVTAVHAKPPAA